MKRFQISILLMISMGSLCAFPVDVIVKGNANPFLSGSPDGTTVKSDSLPAEAPVMVPNVAGGDIFTFAVTGSVSYGGGTPTRPPDGGGGTGSESALGIAGYTIVPIDSLVGVFLTDLPPANPAPAQLQYPPEGMGYTTLTPSLRQIFFIGDGLTGNGTGTVQQIVAPPGAARLFLGTTDGFGWYNNTGQFAVNIARLSSAVEPPELVPTTIAFDLPAYRLNAGQPVAGTIRIDPVPVGGLYSQGMLMTVRNLQGNLAGVVTPKLATALNFDGVLPDQQGSSIAGAGSGGIKGSAQFSIALETLTTPTLGSFTVENLPSGRYEMTLTPWNELGPTEDIFVTGRSRTLDSYITFLPSTVEIIGDLLPEITLSGPIIFQRQTGLLEQKLTLTNNTGATINGFRLFVRDLPEGVTLWNAHGSVDGVAYIDIFTSIAPGASIVVTLEYYRANRDPNMSPAFAVGAAGIRPATHGDGVLDLDLRVLRKDNVGLLLEFKTEKDKRYIFEYSDDLREWKATLPAVTGTGERIQWIDAGPPKTDSFPQGSRFYRVTTER